MRALGAEDRAQGALGFPQHSLPAPAACSPSGSAFRRWKHAGSNRDFCSSFVSFPLSFSLFIDLKAKPDH